MSALSAVISNATATSGIITTLNWSSSSQKAGKKEFKKRFFTGGASAEWIFGLIKSN